MNCVNYQWPQPQPQPRGSAIIACCTDQVYTFVVLRVFGWMHISLVGVTFSCEGRRSDLDCALLLMRPWLIEN